MSVSNYYVLPTTPVGTLLLVILLALCYLGYNYMY